MRKAKEEKIEVDKKKCCEQGIQVNIPREMENTYGLEKEGLI